MTAPECSAYDGTTYTNYAGECRKRANCKPSSDLSVCSCDVSACDSSSPPPTTTDASIIACSKSLGSLYINGQKIGTDGCISGVNTRYECKPSSVSGYSLSFSGTYYDVWVDGSCSSGVTSGFVSYTFFPHSVVKGNKFTVESDIKLDSIADSDCLRTTEGCRLLFELGPESCPSGSCINQLKPQAIIPIFSEKSACDNSPYWSSTTTIVKSGDTVHGTFIIQAPSLIGQYKYNVNVFRGCGDIQLPISTAQFSIEVKDGIVPPPETKFFCLSSDKKTCTSRLGNCLNGETTFTDGITCEANIGVPPPTDCVNGQVAGTGTLTNPLKCCGGYEITGVIGNRKCVKITPQTTQDITKCNPETLENCPKKSTIETNKLASATLADKLASQCERSIECKNNNCIALKKLEDDGIITKTDANALASDLKGTLTGTGIGAVGGLALCVAGAGFLGFTSGGLLTFPILIGVCSGGGALTGGIAGYWTSQGIQAIQSGNKEGYGFCIEESTSDFKWSKFVDSIGKGVNEAFGGKAKTGFENSTMGYIVLVVVAIFIIIILSGRK